MQLNMSNRVVKRFRNIMLKTKLKQRQDKEEIEFLILASRGFVKQNEEMSRLAPSFPI